MSGCLKALPQTHRGECLRKDTQGCPLASAHTSGIWTQVSTCPLFLLIDDDQTAVTKLMLASVLVPLLVLGSELVRDGTYGQRGVLSDVYRDDPPKTSKGIQTPFYLSVLTSFGST